MHADAGACGQRHHRHRLIIALGVSVLRRPAVHSPIRVSARSCRLDSSESLLVCNRAVDASTPRHEQHGQRDRLSGPVFDAWPHDGCSSARRLARHVDSFGEAPIRSTQGLWLVLNRMPWMCQFALSPLHGEAHNWAGALARFGLLRSLSLDLDHMDGAWTAFAPTVIISAIGSLRKLETLHLSLPRSFVHELSFCSLSTLPALRHFSLQVAGASASDLSDTQITRLREMTAVVKFQSPWLRVLERMLQPGHALQWTSLSHWIELREPLASLLGSLSALTKLKASLYGCSVNFLSS